MTAPVKVQNAPAEQREALTHRQRSLYLRLEDGYAQIERRITEGKDATRWEDVWMRLLWEYERISDELREELDGDERSA